MAACRACGAELDQLLREEPSLANAWAGLPRKRFKAGQLIAQAGDQAHAVWHVASGLVRTYYLSVDGAQRNRSFHMERQWVGMPAQPGPATRPYAVESLEPTVLTELPHDTMRAWALRGDLQDRLMDAVTRSLLRREEREESLLLKDASQRYLDFMARERALSDRLPLHHVASYLGITNVALSRIRRRLKEQGMGYITAPGDR